MELEKILLEAVAELQKHWEIGKFFRNKVINKGFKFAGTEEIIDILKPFLQHAKELK